MEIEALKPHEETTEEAVDKLEMEIKKDQIVRDPLIVEQDHQVILDGMHRFGALRRLGSHSAPVCLVNYNSPQISVGSWYRYVDLQDPVEIAERALSDLKFNYALNRVEHFKEEAVSDAIILTNGQRAFTLAEQPDLIRRCQAAVNIEKRLMAMGHSATYLSEKRAMQLVHSRGLIIIVPQFTKKRILKLGLEGTLLPHKVTRHVIPSRPLGLDVPLSQLLIGDTKKANETLTESLSVRRIDKKPPGSIVRGRKYDEELIIFSS